MNTIKNWKTPFTFNLLYVIGLQDQKKVVALEGCELSDCNIDKKQFAFRIKPRGGKRVYFFCADSERDQQEWMQAICFAKASGHMGDGSQACTIQWQQDIIDVIKELCYVKERYQVKLVYT